MCRAHLIIFTPIEHLQIEVNLIKVARKYVLYQTSCGKLLQSCLTLYDTMNCSMQGSSVHGFLQARILEWVAMPSSRGSYRPRDWIHVSSVSCIGRQVLTTSATWEADNAFSYIGKAAVMPTSTSKNAIGCISIIRQAKETKSIPRVWQDVNFINIMIFKNCIIIYILEVIKVLNEVYWSHEHRSRLKHHFNVLTVN